MKRSTALFLIIIALAAGFFAHYLIPQPTTKKQPDGVNKLSWTIDLLENTYVDSISRDSLLDMVVPYLISNLDPHSSYIPAKDLSAVNEPLAGKFDGIGVVFNMATDTAQILNVIAGGPSSEVGIVAGDRIMTVDDTLVAGRKMDQNKVVGMMRGEKGSKVRLGVMRGNNRTLLPFTITRGEIPISSIEASFVAPDKSGYIRLSRFAATTYTEIMEAIKKLQAEGADKLVIDLRGNGGGYFDPAVALSNEFLKKGESIVYIEGAHRPRKEQRANGSGSLQSIPLTILIDESTASSSEIFAGAMQDNDRATIVGRRSFGKGLIQEQIGYTDGSAARITIARYYTPLGRPLQKPYQAGNATAYEHELRDRYNSAEMFSADSIHRVGAQKFITKGGRILYGGGGITPDEFVAVDTVTITPYFIKVFSKNLVFRFAQRFVDNYRSHINTVKTFGDLERFFAAHPNLYSEFIAYATREGVPPTAAELSANRRLLTAELKAHIGRNTKLQESAFYYYIAPVDVVMSRAIK